MTNEEVSSVTDRPSVRRISPGGVVPAPPARRLPAVVLAIVTSLGGSWSSAQDGIDLRGRLDASPGGTLLGNRPGPSIGRTPPSAYQRRNVLPPDPARPVGPPIDVSRLPAPV